MFTIDKCMLLYLNNDSIVICDILTVDSQKNYCVKKPQVINYDQENDMIYLTDFFENLSISEILVISGQNVLSVGKPHEEIERIYRKRLTDGLEDDEDDELEDLIEDQKDTRTVH
jgi:hypothetical protein